MISEMFSFEMTKYKKVNDTHPTENNVKFECCFHDCFRYFSLWVTFSCWQDGSCWNENSPQRKAINRSVIKFTGLPESLNVSEIGLELF